MLRDDGAGAVPDVLRALEVIEQRSGSLGKFIAEYARLARLPTPVLAPIGLGEHVLRVAAMEDAVSRRKVVAGREAVVAGGWGELLEQAARQSGAERGGGGEHERGRGNVGDRLCKRRGRGRDHDLWTTGRGSENPDNLFVPALSTKPGSGEWADFGAKYLWRRIRGM